MPAGGTDSWSTRSPRSTTRPQGAAADVVGAVGFHAPVARVDDHEVPVAADRTAHRAGQQFLLQPPGQPVGPAHRPRCHEPGLRLGDPPRHPGPPAAVDGLDADRQLDPDREPARVRPPREHQDRDIAVAVDPHRVQVLRRGWRGEDHSRAVANAASATPVASEPVGGHDVGTRAVHDRSAAGLTTVGPGDPIGQYAVTITAGSSSTHPASPPPRPGNARSLVRLTSGNVRAALATQPFPPLREIASVTWGGVWRT